jgi:phosphate starvation-inducible PhoH-like protein
MTESKEKRVPKGKIKFKLELTKEQKESKAEILRHTISILTGVAGTSKTFLACQTALDLHFSNRNQYERITIMRPMVGTEDNKMGALPGTLEEKVEPWMIPIRENMYQLYDKTKIDTMFKEGIIRTLPLQYCQGLTFTDEVVIIDESQNATAEQFEMILTRLGKRSKMIFTGDPNQIQLKQKSKSGLQRLIDIVPLTENLTNIVLTENYRNPIIREIIKLYNK